MLRNIPLTLKTSSISENRDIKEKIKTNKWIIHHRKILAWVGSGYFVNKNAVEMRRRIRSTNVAPARK